MNASLAKAGGSYPHAASMHTSCIPLAPHATACQSAYMGKMLLLQRWLQRYFLPGLHNKVVSRSDITC